MVFQGFPGLEALAPNHLRPSPPDHLLTLGLLHQASTLPPLQLPDWAPGWLRQWGATEYYHLHCYCCQLLYHKKKMQ